LRALHDCRRVYLIAFEAFEALDALEALEALEAFEAFEALDTRVAAALLLEADFAAGAFGVTFLSAILFTPSPLRRDSVVCR